MDDTDPSINENRPPPPPSQILNKEKSEMPKQPSLITSWFTGVLLVVLPFLFLFFFFRRTVEIAGNSAASWWLDLCVLIGSMYLLFSKTGTAQNRKIVEVTIFVAACSVFIAKFVLHGMPH